jgi:hypothetical protein
MKRINYCFITFVALAMAALCLAGTVKAEDAGREAAMDYVKSHRWASSTIDEKGKHQITIHDGDTLIILTEGETDNKPSWSKEGDMLTFFRWNGTYLGKKVLGPTRSSSTGITTAAWALKFSWFRPTANSTARN